MKLAKRFGGIGFLLGFIGPILFYALHVESQIACPLCPYVMVPFVSPLGWLETGLKLGLLQGLVFGLLGFVIGFSISARQTA